MGRIREEENIDEFAFARSNAYRVDKIISVKEPIANLSEEYEKAYLI
jgi:nitronate monooxygenase